ncbi:MAG TPA: DUF6101 family protein [Pseudolabrys sp.]|jgi:hypothetical protein|nr:DUF6101 family protein [Pseudolabrys sp.]
MRSGGCPAGSGRVLRLDPFALPVRYAASDVAADGGAREIELHRERVVVRRSLAGMRMALNMPVAAFAGVGLRLNADEAAVVLAHQDPGLAVPLFLSDKPDDVTAAWRSWGAVLGLPLLVEAEGAWHEPFPQLGALRIADPRPRRRRRSALKRRRPSILMRRMPGKITANTPVHRGEHEIIARN